MDDLLWRPAAPAKRPIGVDGGQCGLPPRHLSSIEGFADSKLRPVSLKGLSVRLPFKKLKSSFIEKIPTELQYLGDSPPYSTPEILCTVVSGIFICFCEGIVS
jgi:hypothetical protein